MFLLHFVTAFISVSILCVFSKSSFDFQNLYAKISIAPRSFMVRSLAAKQKIGRRKSYRHRSASNGVDCG